MYCLKCGNVIPDNSIFCNYCGAPVNRSEKAAQTVPPSANGYGGTRVASPSSAPHAPAAQTPYAPPAPAHYAPPAPTAYASPASKLRVSNSFSGGTAAPVPKRDSYAGAGAASAPRFCTSCGSVIPAGSSFCTTCAKAAAAAAGSAPARNSKKALAWILAAAAAVALIVVGVILIVKSQYGGPANEILYAAKNTLIGESFTAKLSGRQEGRYNDNDYDYDYRYGPSSYQSEGKATLQAIIDPEAREITAVLRNRDSDDAYAIYDGYGIIVNHYYYYDNTGTYKHEEYRIVKYDISDWVDAFFDTYEETGGGFGELDFVKILDRIDERGRLSEEIGEELKLDEIGDCITQCWEKLNDADWLTENAGYAKSSNNGTTIHSFKLDNDNIEDSAKELLEILRPVIRDRDDYDRAKENIEDSLRDFDLQAEAEIAIDGGYLVSVEVKNSYTDRYNDVETTLSIEFEDIGSTDIDVDELEEWLDEATYEGRPRLSRDQQAATLCRHIEAQVERPGSKKKGVNHEL